MLGVGDDGGTHVPLPTRQRSTTGSHAAPALASATATSRVSKRTAPSSSSAHGKRAAATVPSPQPVLTDEAASNLDALRESTTRLLARHLNGPLLLQQPSLTTTAAAASAPENGAAASDAALAATASYFREPPPWDRYSNVNNNNGNGAREAPPSADDRITARTLHLLLGKSRAVAERALPPSSSSSPSLLHNQRYTFGTDSRRAEREAELPHSLAARSGKIASSIQQMNTAIKYQEPPAVGSSSQSVRYYHANDPHPSERKVAGGRAATTTTIAARDEASNDGEARAPPAGSFHTHPPDTAESRLLRYPPVPVQYANADAKKRAMTRKRLGLSRDAEKAAGGEGQRSPAATTREALLFPSHPHPTASAGLPVSDLGDMSAKAKEGSSGHTTVPDAARGAHLPHIPSGGGGGGEDAMTTPRGTRPTTDEEQWRLHEDGAEWVETHEVLDLAHVDVPPSRQRVNPTLQYAITATATRGEDGALIQQLVRLYGKLLHSSASRQQQKQQQSLAPSACRSGRSEKGKDEVSFPLLEAVLSVSREFDQVRVAATSRLSAGDATQDRQNATTRLTSLAGTRIPEQYWVTAQRQQQQQQQRRQRALATRHSGRAPRQGSPALTDMSPPGEVGKRGKSLDTSPHVLPDGDREEEEVAGAVNPMCNSVDGVSRASLVPHVDMCGSALQSDTKEGLTREGLVLFPAPRPVGRAQVYLLAETLDHMLNADPLWLHAIADRETAYAILPPPPTTTSAEAVGVGTDTEHANALMDPEAQWRSHHAYERYTHAASHVLTVLDVGLGELVRQVSAQCVERGALLDALREMIVDIAESHVRVLAHAKERAFDEATARVVIREELTETQARLEAAQATIAALRADQAKAEEESSALRVKAARLDELVSRVEARQQRYEIQPEDTHTCILQELERQMRQSASVALDSVFEERCRLAGLSPASSSSTDDDDDAGNSNSSNDESKGRDNLRGDSGEDSRGKRASGGAADGSSSVEGRGGGIGGFSDAALRAELRRQSRKRRTDKKRSQAAQTGRAAQSSTTGPVAPRSLLPPPSTSASSPAVAGTRAGIAEAPSVEEARKRVAEEKEAASTLYQHAYQLLRTLHEATEALNAASAPLYDKVVLKTVSPAANVATSRWATVARAIGAFERDKSHRQRVFAVFCDWCDRYQAGRARESQRQRVDSGKDGEAGKRKEKEKESLEEGGEKGNTHSLRVLRAHAQGTPTGGSSRSPVHGGGDFLLASSSSDNVGENSHGHRHRAESLCDASAASFMSLPSTAQSARGGGDGGVAQIATEAKQEPKGTGEKPAEGTHSLREIRYITPDDLLEMEVHDCTADEVNLLFANGFDFRKYLHPVWKPLDKGSANTQIAARAKKKKKEEEADTAATRNELPDPTSHSSSDDDDGGSTQSNRWTLTLPDMAEMMQDVQATLREMTLRMRAMATSAILQKGVQPPMQPPARPEDPCQLCGRRDTVAEEKTRRQQALRRVAEEVQSRLDTLTEKCQRAEAEREDARGDARRLLAEVQNLRNERKELQRQLQRHEAPHNGEDGAGRGSATKPTRRGGGGSPRAGAATATTPRGIIKRRGSGILSSDAGSGGAKAASSPRKPGVSSPITPRGGSRGRSRKVVTLPDSNTQQQQQTQDGRRSSSPGGEGAGAADPTRRNVSLFGVHEDEATHKTSEHDSQLPPGSTSDERDPSSTGTREREMRHVAETNASRRSTLPPSAIDSSSSPLDR